MPVTLALKTLAAIDHNIFNDQGASFRVAQGQVMPHMHDAYRGQDGGHRTHLGASLIGKECGRSIWYGWRWARKPKFPARILRLFNRGHLEEARFIAMFLAIGVQVYQQDSNGNQFRISDIGGHFGGSGDGVAVGIPDVPVGAPCLLEFKTHGEKSFIKLKKEGVFSAKHEHYVQMQIYMKKMGLQYALYGAVNKNTDEIYMEIIQLDQTTADDYISRARKIIMMRTAPDRLPRASPSLFNCMYCEDQGLCFDNDKMDKNCRTCHYAQPQEDGTWTCESKDRANAMKFQIGETEFTGESLTLTKERQLKGCNQFYVPL